MSEDVKFSIASFDRGFMAGVEFGFRRGEAGENLEAALAAGQKIISDERAAIKAATEGQK